MNERYDNRLMARMFAQQARILHTDGMVKEAKDLLVNAFAILLWSSPQPQPALIPIRIKRR